MFKMRALATPLLMPAFKNTHSKKDYNNFFSKMLFLLQVPQSWTLNFMFLLKVFFQRFWKSLETTCPAPPPEEILRGQ